MDLYGFTPSSVGAQIVNLGMTGNSNATYSTLTIGALQREAPAQPSAEPPRFLRNLFIRRRLKSTYGTNFRPEILSSPLIRVTPRRQPVGPVVPVAERRPDTIRQCWDSPECRITIRPTELATVGPGCAGRMAGFASCDGSNECLQ